MNDFEQYLKQVEPKKYEKAIIWQTAIGLQQVDGLTPSSYLIETAKQNIEGDITFDEVKSQIDTYYKIKSKEQIDINNRTQEADKVSVRIAEILSEKTFSFSPIEYLNIHKRLFSGIYEFAGKIRTYNITKKEWVLDGETVLYSGADNIRDTLEYDFLQEKKFDYKGLSKEQIIVQLVHFITDLWQIHIFGEGNTRTTAVFLIKYLHKLGFKNINNDLFAKHSWYFRNALIRANYEDLSKGIYKANKYIVSFFENLLLNKNNKLSNRELHINFVSRNIIKPLENQQITNDYERLSKEEQTILLYLLDNKTTTRKEVVGILGLKNTKTYEILNELVEKKLINREGLGRGTYYKLIIESNSLVLHKKRV